MSHVRNRIVAWSGGLALLWTWGCASQQHPRPSPQQISSAYQSVRTAWAQGAGGDQRAAPFLVAAERELQNGRRSLDAGQNRDANWSLTRAAVDGQLSQALVQRSRMERQVAQTESRLSEVRASMSTPSGGGGEE
jgi:hypothetical protein